MISASFLNSWMILESSSSSLFWWLLSLLFLLILYDVERWVMYNVWWIKCVMNENDYLFLQWLNPKLNQLKLPRETSMAVDGSFGVDMWMKEWRFIWEVEERVKMMMLEGLKVLQWQGIYLYEFLFQILWIFLCVCDWLYPLCWMLAFYNYYMLEIQL